MGAWVPSGDKWEAPAYKDFKSCQCHVNQGMKKTASILLSETKDFANLNRGFVGPREVDMVYCLSCIIPVKVRSGPVTLGRP